MSILSQLRPYRRRLALLVILAALAGVVLGELAPARPGATAKSPPTHQTRK